MLSAKKEKKKKSIPICWTRYDPDLWLFKINMVGGGFHTDSYYETNNNVCQTYNIPPIVES